MFSSAKRFSNPMSQAMPNGTVAVGGMFSLMMGIRARGSILTWKLVSAGRVSWPGGEAAVGEATDPAQSVVQESPRALPARAAGHACS